MAIKFQYNKTSLQSLNKNLNIRLRTLPTLKNKEATLRFEVAKARKTIQTLNEKFALRMTAYTQNPEVWSEFQSGLISIGELKTKTLKIAGLKTPVLDELIFRVKDFSLFNEPKWFPKGISIIKELVGIAIERNFFTRKMELLNRARRKTTQKVNLYEKVQIPGYEDAIRKIKRFLEDEENLSKSAQKIIKNRHQTQTEINR